jgi:putative oxidoreductase
MRRTKFRLVSKLILSGIPSLLIFLWAYAALSKLLNFEQSRNQMLQQVFPVGLAEILAWAVSVAELSTAGLLIFKKTQTAGLYISLFLLIQFTIYTGLVMLNAFGHIPCSCGGILEKMSWGQHLVFNLFFLFMTIIALLPSFRERGLMRKEVE